MRRRLTVVLAEGGATFVLRGWRGGELARDAGLKPVWSAAAGGNGGWILDASRPPDLLAAADRRNIAVQVEGVGLTDIPSPDRSDRDVHRDDDQLDLFGGDAG
jgi:hypothetical protein